MRHGHPREPAAKALAVAQLMELPMRAHKGLLRHVLGILLVAQTEYATRNARLDESASRASNSRDNGSAVSALTRLPDNSPASSFIQ
jgi:hypothetical protein